MDPIVAISPMLITRDEIPLAYLRSIFATMHPKRSVNGFGPWLSKLRDQVELAKNVKLVKVRGKDALAVADPVTHLRRAKRHGAKAMGQKHREIRSYDAIMQRTDAPNEMRVAVLGRRDKAASSLADMSTKQRLRDRVSKLLDGK